MVVENPCPGYTRVSSGSTISLFIIEDSSSSRLPVSKSVLPTLILNSVSPLIKTLSCKRQMLSAVCPGVCITVILFPKKSITSPSLSSASAVAGIYGEVECMDRLRLSLFKNSTVFSKTESFAPVFCFKSKIF